MGDIRHWVTKIEPTKLAAAGIYAFALIACANIIADALRSKDSMSFTISIQNEGNKPVMKAFKVDSGGNLVPVK